MPRPGYRSITITDEVYELIEYMKKKYRLSTIELIRVSLKFMDEIIEKSEQIKKKKLRY